MEDKQWDEFWKSQKKQERKNTVKTILGILVILVAVVFVGWQLLSTVKFDFNRSYSGVWLYRPYDREETLTLSGQVEFSGQFSIDQGFHGDVQIFADGKELTSNGCSMPYVTGSDDFWEGLWGFFLYYEPEEPAPVSQWDVDMGSMRTPNRFDLDTLCIILYDTELFDDFDGWQTDKGTYLFCAPAENQQQAVQILTDLYPVYAETYD